MRIFFDFGLGSTVGVAPSGLLPGGDVGTYAWRSLNYDGEDPWHDHVFSFGLRVLCVKHEALVVISYISMGLFVKFYQALV